LREKVEQYLPFYIGCNTNKGKLIGIRKHLVETETDDHQIIVHDTEADDFSVRPYLTRLSSLSGAQSQELIRLGFSIGRPKGYSFAPEAFLYLLSLHVDLFGLIDKGLAEEKSRF
jgi:hypothetical protein